MSSDLDIHGLVVTAMCEFPYELRFGQIVDALCTHLLGKPEEIRKPIKEMSLDVLHSVIDDLVESKDLKKRSEIIVSYGGPVEFYSLRKSLLKESKYGYRLTRNYDEPLNYQKDGN